jgi:hypothetical protein
MAVLAVFNRSATARDFNTSFRIASKQVMNAREAR